MKKWLSLVLALVMALSIGTTALAFTEVEYDDDETPIDLAIKLIDVGDGIINVNFTAPPSNRGYVRNEVVCAVISLYIPKGVEFGDYNRLIFTGDNVTIWQDENFYGDEGDPGMLNHMSKNTVSAFTATSGSGPNAAPFEYAADMALDNEIILGTTTSGASGLTLLEEAAAKQNQTYHFAIFGKVTGDDAVMKVKLTGRGALVNAVAAANTAPVIAANFNFVEIKDGDYQVGYYNPNADGEAANANGSITGVAATTVTSLADDTGVAAALATKIELKAKDILYVVGDSASDVAPTGKFAPKFAVVTDNKYNCKGLYVFDTVWYRVTVLGAKNNSSAYISEWGVNVQFETYVAANSRWEVETTGATISSLARRICQEVVWEDFGLNPARKGQMKPEWWAGNKELEKTVEVQPWYNEVTVPAEIELEAPKTGDVVSALGFVLIALAGLAFVAVRKVRA